MRLRWLPKQMHLSHIECHCTSHVHLFSSFSTFVRRNIFKCTSFRLKHFQIISFAEILLSKFYLKFETIMHGRKESLHTLFRIRTSKLNAINCYAFFIFFKSERVKKLTLCDYGVGSFLPSKNLLFLAASLEAIFTTKNVLNYYLSLSLSIIKKRTQYEPRTMPRPCNPKWWLTMTTV
jgi:hypothetical protein